jgi:protein ImuA
VSSTCLSPPRAARAGPQDPEALHPGLWRANRLGRAGTAVVWRSGFAALDAELPGGGWPCQALTELLLPRPGIGEVRLLAPVLTAVAAVSGRAAPEGSPRAMWFAPPALPCAQALAQLGVDAHRLVVVPGTQVSQVPGSRARPPVDADLLWALEQALRSGAAGPVLAWLPGPLSGDRLRRLQLAAQAHEAPAFVLRGLDARQQPSPAPLRLALQPQADPDALSVHLLKRRGPAQAQPLHLALPPVLAGVVGARARARQAAALAGQAGRQPAVLTARPSLQADRAASLLLPR